MRRIGRNLGLNIEEFREIEYSTNINNNMTTLNSDEQQQIKLKPQALTVSTALEIGVLPNPKVPSLVKYLLPSKSSSFSVKYLQKLLICPPTHHISQHFRQILHILSKDTNIELPKITTISTGKIVSLLSAHRCNYETFREMADNMMGIQNLLTSTLKVNNSFANSLLTLAAYESGVSIINSEEFLSRLSKSINLINSSISTNRLELYECENFTEIEEFFRRNEETFHSIFVPGIISYFISSYLFDQLLNS